MPLAGPHELKEARFTGTVSAREGTGPASLRGSDVLRMLADGALACAARHARCRIVMAKADAIELRRQLPAGGGVGVHARVAFSGRSSMTVLAEIVDAESPQAGPAASGRFMLIAVDGEGVPVPIPDQHRPEETAS